MKKLKFLLGILTIVAGTSLLSSCFSDPTFGENPTVVPPSAETEYTVTVNTNADTLTYKVAGKDAEEVRNTFHPTADGELFLTKEGRYEPQTVNIVLGENKNIVLNVTLIETPTSDTSVADANGNTERDTKIDDKNNTSSIVIPAGVQTTGVDGGANFGIGVYSAVAVADEPVKEEDKVENDDPHDVLVAVCEPSGAVFDEPVTISVAAQNAAGLSFRCINEEDEAKGIAPQPVTVGENTLSAQVSHFSNWTFSLMARVINIETTTETLFDGNILIHTGSNIFNYTAKTGVSSDRSGIAETFLIGQFGSRLTNVAKTGTLSATGEGSAHIQVVQDKKIITYKSGENATFKATVYGAIHVNVLSTTYDTSEHSGGTGGGY